MIDYNGKILNELKEDMEESYDILKFVENNKEVLNSYDKNTLSSIILELLEIIKEYEREREYDLFLYFIGDMDYINNNADLIIGTEQELYDELVRLYIKYIDPTTFPYFVYKALYKVIGIKKYGNNKLVYTREKPNYIGNIITARDFFLKYNLFCEEETLEYKDFWNTVKEYV